LKATANSPMNRAPASVSRRESEHFGLSEALLLDFARKL
jgi:hypothetical protein